MGCVCPACPQTLPHPWELLPKGLPNPAQPKFWCYPGTLYTCSDDIITTSSLQPAVRRDRFSIRDNRAQREFTVTMEGLAEGDTGTYICGVRTGAFKADERHFVKVIVAQGQSPHVPPPHSTSAHHRAGPGPRWGRRRYPAGGRMERDKGGSAPGGHPLHLSPLRVCSPDAQPGPLCSPRCGGTDSPSGTIVHSGSSR
uniref:Immunoglobulin V-set domain-containing protein n=1 Tax=Strix occidentalis caurina TaxID=311401 RepID=A0A8D0FA12_STROC